VGLVSFAPHAQQPLSSAQPAPVTDKLPTASLNVATGHASQAPASSRKPALQRHEPAAEAVAGCELAGQATHAEAADAPVSAEYVLATDAPTVVEYLPAPQSMQVLAVEAPEVPEYLPAPQLVHVETPV